MTIYMDEDRRVNGPPEGIYTYFRNIAVEVGEIKYVCGGKDYEHGKRQIELETVSVVPGWEKAGVDVIDVLDPDVLDSIHAAVYHEVTGEEREPGIFYQRA